MIKLLLYLPFHSCFRKRHSRNEESQEEGVEDNEQPRKKKSRRTRDTEVEERSNDNGESKSAEE